MKDLDKLSLTQLRLLGLDICEELDKLNNDDVEFEVHFRDSKHYFTESSAYMNLDDIILAELKLTTIDYLVKKLQIIQTKLDEA